MLRSISRFYPRTVGLQSFHTHYVRQKKLNPAEFLTMEAPKQSQETEDINYDDTEELARRERIQKQNEEKDRQRFRRNMRIVGSFVGVGSLLGFVMMGMPKDEQDVLPDESAVGGYVRRVKEGVKGWFNKTAAPVYGEKLLPDAIPSPYTRKYTLVVELNDALVHLVWDKEIGWRIATRPGMKHFLHYLSNFYEIVIFANTPSYMAHPVADAIDRYGMAPYKLYRESTRFVDGKLIKDLSALNRDLSKVVCVDVNDEAFSLQPENGLMLKAWKGEKGDEELKKMTTLLEEMFILAEIAQLEDIRPLLKIVNTHEDPFGAWQKHKETMKAEIRAKQPQQSRSVFSMLRGSSPAAQSTTVFDYVEKIAKEQRTQHEKSMKEQLAELEKMRQKAEEEHLKQIEGMKAQNMKMMDYLFGATEKQQ